MSVTPLRPQIRYYCSKCDIHHFQHEAPNHANCIDWLFCTGCGRAASAGDTDCPMCGAVHPEREP